MTTDNRSLRLLVLLVLIMSIAFGCANPSIEHVRTERLAGLKPRTIFVPRFEGNPNFVEESTDLFVSLLQSQVDIQIIQGGPLRAEGDDVHSGSNLLPVEYATNAARRRGADTVIMGKVTSYSNGTTGNGFSTVRLINVSDGEIVASFHRPSGLLFGYGEHQAVMAAVKRTAADIAKILRGAGQAAK